MKLVIYYCSYRHCYGQPCAWKHGGRKQEGKAKKAKAASGSMEGGRLEDGRVEEAKLWQKTQIVNDGERFAMAAGSLIMLAPNFKLE